jgi:hypothetical protein
MRVRAQIAVAGWAALIACLPPVLSWGQVQIVRELPPTGENQAQAQWGPPLPTAQAPGTGRGAKAGGRISLGASGGINDSGAPTLDAALEGNLSLLVPFGTSSSFTLTGDAARKPGLDGLDQAYKAALKIALDALQAEVGGSFHQQDRSEASGSTGELEGDAHASVSLGLIPTLPISASYAFQRTIQNQTDFTGAFAQITDAVSHTAQLKGAGTIGSVGVDTGANFSDVTDVARSMQIIVFGGNLGVTVPIASFLKVFATVLPKYNATSYTGTGNSSANTTLEDDLGFLIPITEPLAFKIGAGRIDQWSSQAGPSANTDPSVPPYSVTWKGLAGVEWKPAATVSASATYGFGKTVDGPFVHSLDTSFGYQGGGDSFVKNLVAAASDTLSLDGTGVAVNNQASWNTSASLGSQEAVGLAASYSGSVSGVSQLSLTNAAHLSFTHQIIPELSYGLGADLTQASGPELQSTFLQTYQAKLTVAPRLGDRAITFTADDTLALDAALSPLLIVSKAGAGITVPIFAVLGARERFDWEWDSATAPGAAAGNAFKNAVGLTLSGQKLPVSIAVDYALSFGFRGIRHDGTLSMNAAFGKGFSLTGSLSISEYDLGSGPTIPFIATISGAYAF